MVDQTEAVECEICASHCDTSQYTAFFSLGIPRGWMPYFLCSRCIGTGYGIGMVEKFDTQEERDLWLIKQRL